MKLLARCPFCNKASHTVNEVEMCGTIIRTFACGHTHAEKKLVLPEGRTFNWTKLRPYQQEAVKHIEQANFCDIIGDDIGLGKTIEVLYCVDQHRNLLLPALAVVKASLKYNWAIEYQNWVSSELVDLPYVITDSSMPILPGFKFYIISMSLLAKKIDELAKIGIKLLIVDESHHFKNGESGRTAALRKLVSIANIPYKICTSGTPILNRAPEFFTTLNLVRPMEWYSQIGMCRNWCEQNEKGVYTRIDPYRLEAFQKKIKPYFLRREKRDVLKDLPPFQRYFRWIDIEDENFKKLYNSELSLFSNWYNNSDNRTDSISILGWLTKLRRITGLAKISACLEDALEFLLYSTEEAGNKIAIGATHRAVISGLKLAFEENGYEVITITGEDNAEKKLAKERLFRESAKHRILIGNIEACGEGLNLQFCNIFVILERQWNAAKEVQFEGRFDRFGQLKPTKGDYFVARGTVDEYYTNMVESKRRNCGEAMGDQYSIVNDAEGLKEVVQKTLQNKL